MIRRSRFARSHALLLVLSSAVSACVAPPETDEIEEAVGSSEAAIAPGAELVSNDGHRVFMSGCNGSSSCVTDIPMTGTVSPLFAEVDLAMRQFMKTHCVGSGVLAISYKGRRVYKRGFGRMRGSSMESLPAHCSQDTYSTNAGYVLPDTDVSIGSASKFVTGSMVRDLVWDRIVDRGLTGRYSEPTQALLLDPDLELLPPALLRYFDQERPDAECPPVPMDDIEGCTRVPGCGGSGPDQRWQLVTIGDLIAHTSGLPGGSPEFETAVSWGPTLRGHDSWAELFLFEHLQVRENTSHQVELDAARQYLADTANVDADDVFFVSPWDRTSYGAQPVDDILTLIAGRCLNPDEPTLGQSDSDPQGAGDYANGNFAFLERVIAHLHPTHRFSAYDEAPETQAYSALQQHLEALGMEAGVQNEYAMFTRQKMTANAGGPERRAWSEDHESYRWTRASKVRPFCIWDGATCDFSQWLGGSDAYRLPWDFSTNEITFDADTGGVIATNMPPLVPFEQSTYVPNPGTGQIAVEAPALLKLAGTFFVGARNDVRLGKRRSTCNDCDVAGHKGGDAGGSRARIMTLAGDQDRSVRLPPRDAGGRLTIEPDVDLWTTATWDDADDVDFAVSVHQSEDELGGGEGYDVENFIRYALSRVDWAAVDRMVKRQRMRVVGAGINSAGNSYYWYEDERRSVLSGLPKSHSLTPAPEPAGPGAPLPEAGGAGGQAPAPAGTYTLPSTRIGSDIVAVDISANDIVYAYYDDGHYSRGNSLDLDAWSPAQPYSVPDGYSYSDIVGVAITSGNTFVTWFKNGKVATGTASALGTGTKHNFTLPPGQAIGEIVDMAVNRANDHTFTVFKDGSVAEGDYYDLDKFSYRPGKALGMAMTGGDTTIWYQSGYRKELSGSPADNRFVPTVLSTSDHFRLPGGHAYGDVMGVARPSGLAPRIWFRNGARSTANSGGDFLSAGAAGSTTWPLGEDGNTAVAFASHDGITYSWYNTGRRAKGTESNLASTGSWSGVEVPAGQYEYTIDAITIDTGAGGDGFVWTLFRNGAVAKGRSWELHADGYWVSPHVNPLP